jgi:hypothetical protein
VGRGEKERTRILRRRAELLLLLSISDPSHHVTEAIGHMYDDDYDRNDPRRLSYITSWALVEACAGTKYH